MSCNSEEYVKYSTFCMKAQPQIDPWETDVRVHTVEELILICSEGSCTVINNGHTLQIPTPAFIWNRLGSFHMMAQVDQEAEAYIACFHTQIFSDFPKRLLYDAFAAGSSLFALPLTDKQTDRMRQLYTVLIGGPVFQRQMILPCIFYQISHYLKDGRQPIVLANTCDYIVDVVDFLQHHWSEKLTIADLAEKFHVGTTKLKKDFKQITTETIHTYQLRMQVHAARNLLNSTDLSLVQIAVECGFTDESHLIRSFRKVLGSTPGEYRTWFKNRWNR